MYEIIYLKIEIQFINQQEAKQVRNCGQMDKLIGQVCCLLVMLIQSNTILHADAGGCGEGGFSPIFFYQNYLKKKNFF